MTNETRMTDEQIVQALWNCHQQGDFFPDAWKGKLDLEQAYRVQLGLLEMKLAHGEQQAGWKVGLTADTMREMFGGKEPVFGHLLESSSVPSGHMFEIAGLRNPMVENEILVTMGDDLSGPDATLAQARQAMASIAPAFEIVELRGADMRVDLPLAVTDNVGQYAFVHGEPIELLPDFDLGAIRAEVRVNGEVVENALGGDVMDNQVQTVAWLANTLHRYGRRLQAGQRIMSGSFTKPAPVKAGDAVETHFIGVGTVAASFV
jgi:2-oxopent-4-enoate/cis-2-oxohex-4-enoate hydratase